MLFRTTLATVAVLVSGNIFSTTRVEANEPTSLHVVPQPVGVPRMGGAFDKILEHNRTSNCALVDERRAEGLEPTMLESISAELRGLPLQEKARRLVEEINVPPSCVAMVMRNDKGMRERVDILLMAPEGDTLFTDDPEYPVVSWERIGLTSLRYYAIGWPMNSTHQEPIVVGIER